MGIGIFIGILLILAGIGLIVKIIFNIDLPVFKIFFALLFIYIGVKMLSGNFNGIKIRPGSNASIFGETYLTGIPQDNEYTVIFGYSKIDLSNEDFSESDEKLDINVIFGGCDLLFDSKQPLNINAETAFGEVELPGKKESAFGKIHHKTEKAVELEKGLKIEANAVFGKFQAIEKR
jgi:predicted membrane protein